MTLELSLKGGVKERRHSGIRSSSTGRDISHLDNRMLIGILRMQGLLNE